MRCPLYKNEPACLVERETVLIDTDSAELLPVDLANFTEDWAISSPVVWAPGDAGLLLRVRHGTGPGPVPITLSMWEYVLYSPSDGTFEPLDLDPGLSVIGWGRKPSELLVDRYYPPLVYVFGWQPLAGGDFEEETVVVGGVAFASETVTTSAKAGLILSGDTPSAWDCQDVVAHRIGSGGSFSTLIPLACFPTFSQDGGRLAYVAKVNSEARPTRLTIANADGSNPTPLFSQELPNVITYPAWSPDGSHIAFTYGAETGANAVYLAEVPERLRPSGPP